jgi:hypothetical protein
LLAVHPLKIHSLSSIVETSNFARGIGKCEEEFASYSIAEPVLFAADVCFASSGDSSCQIKTGGPVDPTTTMHIAFVVDDTL